MKMRNLILFVTMLLFPLPSIVGSNNNTKLTVVVIVDQFAHHYITKLQKHFKYGLNFLLSNGVVYNNAYFPHGVPETTTGHNTLNTGCLPKDHGAVTNAWIDPNNGESIHYADSLDSSKTEVNGLTEQFILNPSENSENKVFAIAIKSHPAIATANKMGKAIWFDDKTGEFTSSQAYYETIPAWVENFNAKKKLNQLKHVIWNTAYNANSACYKFPHIQNYDHTAYKFSFIKKHKIPVNQDVKNPYEYYLRTPSANEMLFELAQTCIDANYSKNDNNKLFIWLSLSPLDFLAHMYGPDCLEPIDLIYHLDKQLKIFQDYLNKKIGQNKYLLVLTADHGVAHIPEIMQKQGIKKALRISAKDLETQINSMLKEKFNISNVVLTEGTKEISPVYSGDMVVAFDPPSFYLNKTIFNTLKTDVQSKILSTIKEFLLEQPGIKNAWTYQELTNATFEPEQLENFYKNQLYHNRVGDIICQVEPNCLLTDYPTGTSHMTPYEYDTHVPLIIYQKGVYEKKQINKRVWMPQLAVTLAKMHSIPKPDASTYDSLPGLF